LDLSSTSSRIRRLISACNFRQTPSSLRPFSCGVQKTREIPSTISSITSTNVLECSTQGLLPLPDIAPLPNICSVRYVSQHFPIQIFSSARASANSRVPIAAAQSSRVTYGPHPSSNYGLHSGSLPDNVKILSCATPTTRSDKTLLSFTPHPVKNDLGVPPPATNNPNVPPLAKNESKMPPLAKTDSKVNRAIKDAASFLAYPSTKTRKAKPRTSKPATSTTFTKLNIRSRKSKSLRVRKKIIQDSIDLFLLTET